jgi:hypothetical protein
MTQISTNIALTKPDSRPDNVGPRTNAQERMEEEYEVKLLPKPGNAGHKNSFSRREA